MHALGLNPQDPQHEQYYRAMRVSSLLSPVSRHTIVFLTHSTFIVSYLIYETY
jgi:hypothetical protein